MATIYPESVGKSNALSDSCRAITAWRNVSAGDTLAPQRVSGHTDKTTQLVGVGDGANIAIHGSLEPGSEPVNFEPLTNLVGDEISLATSGDKMSIIAEGVEYIKPVITGGTGSTDVTIYLYSRG